MGEVWIGVTGFWATENPHPGLAVVRALRRADPSWRILALTTDACATGAFATDLIDAHAIVPYATAGPRVTLARLRDIVKRHRVDVLVPTLDAELRHYIGIRPALRRLGVRTLLPSAAALQAREKRRLPALGVKAGVSVPETVVMRTEADVRRVATRLRYPQVVKGALVDSAIVHTPEELRVAAVELGGHWGYPLLTQPMVTGEEYDVAAVARDGTVVSAAVMKKLGVTGKGTAWAGVTVDEPELVRRVARLVHTLKWNGAIEAEFIRAADGELFCFEVNPRFPSWIALTADAGANLPETLVRLIARERVEPARARPGTVFARTLVERVFDGNPLETLNDGSVREGLLAEAAMVPAAPGRLDPAGAVAISGLNAADNPSPGLTVARSLRALPSSPRLVGLTHEVLSTSVYLQGIWDEVRVLPFPSEEEGGYVHALVDTCRDAGVDCLIPTLDIEVPIVSRLAPQLARAGVATLVPPLAALRATAKSALPRLTGRGFRVPRTETVADLDDLPRVVRQLGLPLVLKGPVSDARPVRNDEEAHVVARRLAGTWGFPLLAQEFIEGEEFGIAAVADRAHRIVGTVTVRKTIKSLNGNTWGGFSVVEPALARLAEHLAGALDWVGPFEIEVLRHPKRGIFLVEVNPRFPAWIYLSAGAGANLPWAVVRLARGGRVPSLETRPGVFYVRMAWDATAPIERMGTLAVEGKVTGDAA
jgi:carbamoyl-phosphate synthase large subunit